VLCEYRVDESVARIQEVEHRPIFAKQIEHEADRLFVHRPAQIVVEDRESFAIDGIELFEPAEIEPGAAKLGREAAGALVLQHTASLSHQHLRPLQLAPECDCHELGIGHPGPQEIAEPARERKICKQYCCPC
jgi:hypothetical protein